MIFHVYRHDRNQHHCTVFSYACLGAVEATNAANAVLAAMAAFKLERENVAVIAPNGDRTYGRPYTGRRRPWTMNGE